MSHEILFTSARSGLRSGSTGFCTVRSTAGLPRNLATALEQLTSYSHAVDPYDADVSNLHPVNFAHYVLRLGTQRFHVLGRVANAPLDHTNRSNKLAQLIAFDSSEVEASAGDGPAVALTQLERQQHWVQAWAPDSAPELLPESSRVVLPSTPLDPPTPCTTWKAAAGHAGWAGVLAEAARGRASFVPVIFSAEQSSLCLPMVREALSLLPPAERWETTFSTYFSANLPTRVECRWRFLLDTSELARKARRNPRLMTIDLPAIRRQGTDPPTSELSTAACGWTRPWLSDDALVVTSVSTAKSTSTHPAEQPGLSAPVAGDTWSSELVPRNFSPGESPARRSGFPADSITDLILNPLVLVLLLLIAVGGLIAMQFLTDPGDSDFDRIVEGSPPPAHPRQPSEREIPTDTPNLGSAPDDSDTTPGDEEGFPGASPPTATPNTKNQPPPETPGESWTTVSPLAGIREAGNVLPLPGLREHAGWFTLVDLACDDPQSLTLSILGDRSVMKTTDVVTEFGPIPESFALAGSHSDLPGWRVIRQNTISTRRKEDVACFRLHENKLQFRWHYMNETAELRNCVLKISTAAGESETCMLRSVESVPPTKLDFSLGRSSGEPPAILGDNELMHTENVNVLLTFQHIPERSRPDVPRSLRVGEAISLSFFEDGALLDSPPVVEVQLSLEETPRHGVRLKQTSFLRWISLEVYADPGSSAAAFRETPKREVLSDARLRQVQDQYADAHTNAEKALSTLRTQIEEITRQRDRLNKEVPKAKLLQMNIERCGELQREYESIRDLCKQFPGRVGRLRATLSKLEQDVEVHFEVSLDSAGSLQPVPLVSSR